MIDTAPEPDDALRQRHGFTIYLTAQAVSLLGDAIAFIAFPLLVFQATGSVRQMGGVTATASISAMVAGFFAGSMVDRMSPRTIILWCDAVRAFVNLAILLSWSVRPQPWLLYAVVAVGAAASTFFQVAHNSMMTTLVAKKRLTTANGRYQATAAIAFLAGTILAAGICAAFGPATAMGVNGVSFAAAAAGTLFVHMPHPQDQAGAAIETGPRYGLVTGLSVVWRQPVLRWLLVLTPITLIFTFGMIDLFIYQGWQGLGQSYANVGAMVAAAAVGALAAAVTAGPLRTRFGVGACWIGSLIVSGLATASLGVATEIVVVPFIGACFAFGATLAVVCSTSVQQELTPAPVMGRAASAFTFVRLMAFGAGVAAMTTMASLFGTRPIFVAAGAALIAIGALSIATPIVVQR